MKMPRLSLVGVRHMAGPLSGGSVGGIAALLLVLAGTPAAAQNNDNFFGNIFKPPGSVQQEQEASRAAQQASENSARMDRIENALRQLTGQVEQLQYRNQQLEAELRRLQGGAPAPAEPYSGGTAAPAVGGVTRPPVAPAAVSPAAGKRSDAFDPNANPAAPGAPQPLGSPASASVAVPDAGAAGPGGVAGGTQVAAAPGSPGALRDLYDSGIAQIQRQDYAAAERLFRQIMDAPGNERIVPDATFMLGESLYLRKNYRDAAQSFLEVSTKYPNSTRAPEALLRLGQSLAGLGEKDTACATFLEVDRKYPRTPAHIRQAVEREQKRVGC